MSIAVLPWMLRHEALWVKRDAVLMMDVGTDVFYIFICTFLCSGVAALDVAADSGDAVYYVIYGHGR